MGTADNNSWTRIQQGLKDIERLIGQKQNNLAMVKARQILEYMVKSLGEKALIVEGDLADSIDQLFEGRWINQSTKEHYHRIRVLGNKAVHDGDDSAYDANEAYHLLSQEVLVYQNHYSGKGRPAAKQQQSQRPIASTAPTRPATQRPSSRPPASGGQQRRPSSQRPSSSNRSRRRTNKRGNDPRDLIKPILLLLVIILIVFFVIKACSAKDNDKKETTESETTTEISTEVMSTTTAPVSTEPETTEAPKIYKTKSKLNVRTEPDTNSTKLGTLAIGTLVDYVDTYDATWTIIMFEGKQAYVATEFLSVEESSAAESTAAPTSAQ